MLPLSYRGLSTGHYVRAVAVLLVVFSVFVVAAVLRIVVVVVVLVLAVIINDLAFVVMLVPFVDDVLMVVFGISLVVVFSCIPCGAEIVWRSEYGGR